MKIKMVIEEGKVRKGGLNEAPMSEPPSQPQVGQQEQKPKTNVSEFIRDIENVCKNYSMFLEKYIQDVCVDTWYDTDGVGHKESVGRQINLIFRQR